MQIEELKLMWISSLIITDKSSIVSTETFQDLANYTIEKTTLNINILSKDFYLNEVDFKSFIIDEITKKIISSGLDYEHSIDNFNLRCEKDIIIRADL
ncbi:hypothetical protein [Zunongwangia pacifica]|uniref:Uncharacterized protein n=1 Tax=Zunongwangia pacifica TaxID=2911062 RepID=A0A9X2CLJ9_9FLAO|nr:hypothetical protein [Zunongwangia pacifica]MCL6218595.1 hypothetical protein [Zunongwangia pacifica]